MPKLPAMQHPQLSRRTAIQAGAIGILGLGMNHLDPLRASAASGTSAGKSPAARSVIYIFLSGGLAQQDSFDLKPEAPDTVRGEFKPIATRTPGIEICEHLPMLAQCSDKWALVRSLTHPYNEHSQGHLVMLTGRTPMPVGFDASQPKPTDWPSIAAIAGATTAQRNNLPPAIVLPEKMIHRTGRVLPGQFAGLMGSQRDPLFIEMCRFNSQQYGAYPEYGFHHARGAENPKDFVFQAPNLSLPPEVMGKRFQSRLALLETIGRQQSQLDAAADVEPFDFYRQRAITMLTDRQTRAAFDVSQADPKLLDRYGRNTFGWSLLMARQLVETGVNLVQVNLGNNETWDTHGNAFPNLKNYLLPPMDRSVSALINDLDERGLLDSTLIVMAGEFGRTPRISGLPTAYKLPGRDHWGAVQTVFFAGGGVRGGTVVGSSDKIGGHPARDPQKPENMAATIYRSLGLHPTQAWIDAVDRPHHIYNGTPIAGLT
jgi:hypothetical protein